MRATRRRVSLSLLLLAILAVASPAAASLSKLPDLLNQQELRAVDVDRLEASLEEADAASPPAIEPEPLRDSRFSLVSPPPPLRRFEDLLERSALLPPLDVEPPQQLDVELLRLPETRVRDFALFAPSSTPCPNRVSTGNVTGFGLGLLAECGGAIESFLSEDPWEGLHQSPPSLHRYLYAHDNPLLFVDPTGMCVLGLPCPKAARQAVTVVRRVVRDQIDQNVALTQASVKTAVQLGEGIARGVVKTADVVTLGAVSSAGTRIGTFVGTEGSLEHRGQAAQEEGNRAQLNTVTFGFSGAENKREHGRQLVRQTFGAEQFEQGSQQLAEGLVNGDADQALRGAAQIIGGSSQVTLVVAGTAQGGIQARNALRGGARPPATEFKPTSTTVGESSAKPGAVVDSIEGTSSVEAAPSGSPTAATTQADAATSIEYNIAPHGRQPRPSSPYASHHGVQRKYLEKNVPGYDAEADPTIMLRDQPGGPHRRITGEQATERAAVRRETGNPYSGDYGQWRARAIEQMRRNGVPEEKIGQWVLEHDAYLFTLGPGL
jgi:hypothetical protein